ncbi:hypothetical protein [Rhodococcus sp. SORGH_AS_0301]|uniref:SPW repeat domain-containing protein n=1 Tax=Rhodococcus sp. SORGH_AS_0301 TaxID=3041780 RepID=UPI002783E16A|nr:hypothetical protein [Rhodococcus sp. SORGH_AS_0301]MDQ1178750.1 hypothetical protein [Rhodococcus sp. SORGH_AS_0301]
MAHSVRQEIVRDAVVLVAGTVLVLSTLWLPVPHRSEVAGAILVLGLLAAFSALWAMGSASRSSHWAHVVLGVVLATSPVVLAFPAGASTADYYALVGGVVIAAMGVLGVLTERRRVAATA